MKKEFSEIKKVVIYFVLILFSVFAGMFVFGEPSLAVKIFLAVKAFLVPPGIQIVALNPMMSFIAPIMMAFLAALLISFPFGLYLTVRFFWPALRPRERKTLLLSIVPSIILFYLGCALAYFIIIPKTFQILYAFASPFDVVPLFALDDFIWSVFFITISVGFAFLLPVFMIVLSRIGIAPPDFWTSHLRGAVVFVVIFTAVITPDGSGVTMAFLAVPLAGLYLIGALAAKFWRPKVVTGMV